MTVPALAVSVLLVNFNAPDGSAATESVLLAALGADDAAVEVAGALVAVDVLAAVAGCARRAAATAASARAAARTETKRQGGHRECEPEFFCTGHISLLLID